MIDFRNLLAHGYDTISRARVWRYIHQDLPPLRTRTAELLRDAEGDDPRPDTDV